MKLEASMDYGVVPGDQRLPCKPLQNKEMGNAFWVSCFISSRLLATEKVWAEGFPTHNCLLTRLDRRHGTELGDQDVCVVSLPKGPKRILKMCWPCRPRQEDS